MIATRPDPCRCGSGKSTEQCCAGAARPQPDREAHAMQWLQQGMALHQGGQFAQADACYQKILAIDPHNVNALQLKGLIAHQFGRHMDAADLIGRAVALRPIPEWRINLAGALIELGRHEEAMRHAREAALAKPQLAEAHTAIGNVLAAMGRVDEALVAYGRASAMKPEDVPTALAQAVAFRRLERFDESLACCRQAVTLAPLSPDPYFHMVKTVGARFLKAPHTDWSVPLPPAEPVAGAISIIICSINDARFRQIEANYRRLLAGEDFEIIRISDARSLCEGYNRGVRQSRGEILIFSHDDIEIFTPDFAARLRRHLGRHDLVGVAGTTHCTGAGWGDAGWPHAHGHVSHYLPETKEYELSAFQVSRPVATQIQAFDGLFFAARRAVALAVPFDESLFDGFHLYDLDFTLRVHRQGYRQAVCNDLVIAHHSKGNFDATWRRYADRFVTKHRLPGTQSARRTILPGIRLESPQELLGFCNDLLKALPEA